MNKKILYITFTDLQDAKSGSSVRPKKIYDTFLQLNYDVTLLSGSQNRILDRWKNSFEFYKKIRKVNYEFCYVEPPSGPFFNFCDHITLLYISKVKKIPIGLFYRDAYWKFADWYQLKGIKKHLINFMHKFDWYIFKKTCKTIYFPTKMMADLFEFKNKDILPPGCEIEEVDRNKDDKIELVYVGGTSEQYGGPLLLEALEEVNKIKEVNLHLVCRETQSELIKKYQHKKWLKVYSASGKELGPIYNKCNISIIPRKIDFYMDFAMPVKLMEYVSFGLPIIATNCKEVAKFINENEIGDIVEDNVESIKNCLLNITISDIKKYQGNVFQCRDNNTWKSRVEKLDSLTK